MPTRAGTAGNDIIPSGESSLLFAEYDVMYGNLGDDTIFGFGGGDLLLGDYYLGEGPNGLGASEPIGGNDTIYGGAGNDTVHGGGGDDILYGNSPNQPTASFEEADDMYGGAGNDILYGQGGIDILHGDGGDDHIEGGRGRDIMFGESGRDTFVFAVGDSTAGDRIRDLNVGVVATGTEPSYSADANLDHIRIVDTAGNPAFTFLGTSAFSAPGTATLQVRYFWIEQSGVTTTRVEIDSNGDATTDNYIDIDGKFYLNADSLGLFGTTTAIDASVNVSIAQNADSLQNFETDAPRFYTYTVTRAGDLSAALDLNWNVQFPSADLGTTIAADADDLGSLSGTTHFDAGSSTASIIIQLNGDNQPEWNEYFQVNLTSALTPISGQLSATSLIFNDDWPTITVTTASPGPFVGQGDSVTLEEGGGAGSVRFDLSHAADFPITITASIIPDGWQGDVSLLSNLVIPAGETSVTLAVAVAQNDNLFEAIETGHLVFTAQGGIDPNTGAPRNIDFAQNDVPLQIIDEALADAGQEELEQGLDWATNFINYWTQTTQVAAALEGIDADNPTTAAGKYVQALGNGAQFAEILYDGTLVKFQLEARLQHARELALIDPQAGASEAYLAFATANVDFGAGLIKTALVGAGTAFSVGVIMGLGLISTATLAAPVLAGIAVGYAAAYTYDQLGFDTLVRNALEKYWKDANPREVFEQEWIESLPEDTPVVSPASIELSANEHDAVLTGDDDVSATGNDLDNILSGNSGNNILYGKGGNDAVFGNDGDDRLIAASGTGNDHYDGGSGTDVITFASSTQGVTVDLGAGTATGSEIGSDFLVSIENVVGGSGADQITGNASPNLLTGGLGNDTFVDTAAGHHGDTLTDFAAGDAIVFHGASVETFTFSLVSNTLVYTGGSITLDNLPPGHLVMTADPLGVRLTLEENVSAGLTITSGTQAVDFDQQPLAFFPGGTVSALTATSFQVSSNYSFQVSGTGFSDTNADGRPDTGTVSSIAVYQGGAYLFTVSGINRSVSEIYGINGYELLGNLLAGDETIHGSSAGDNLRGFTGNDVINGGAGDDRITDNDAGNDIFRGGDGNDTIDAYSDATEGGQSEQIFGDAGDDTITHFLHSAASIAMVNIDGGSGNDLITVYMGGFTNLDVGIAAGSGNDIVSFQLSGNPTFDPTAFVVSGGEGFDEVRFSSVFNNALLAGIQFEGFERLTFMSSAQVTVSCEFLNQFQEIRTPFGGVYLTLSNGGAVDLSGAEQSIAVSASAEGNGIIGGSNNDQLYGNVADDIIHGGAGDDYILGNVTNATTGFDQIFGDAGNDTIYTATSSGFVVDGGTGIDLWTGNFAVSTADLTFNANGAATAAGMTLSDGSVLRNIEAISVSFGSGDDTFIDALGGGDDIIGMGFGNDTVTVTSGRDQVQSGAYANSHGSGGFADTDTIIVDYSTATAGLQMNSYIDTWSPSIYGSSIWQGTSRDTATRRVDFQMFDILSVTGSAFGDQLVGGKTNDTFNGGAGDDIFTAQLGNDVLNGGAGSDWMNFQTMFAVTSGASIDLQLTGAQALPTHGGSYYTGSTALGTVTLSGVENIEGTGFGDTFRGTSQANALYGMGGDDLLDGRDGDDVLRGGSGNDQLLGGNGSDTADYTGAIGSVTVDLALATAQSTGGAGTDTLGSIENLIGSSSADVLRGSNSANALIGAGAADKLFGEDGNDVLTGGAGADELAGGAGSDVFSDTKSGLNGDTIMDFGAGDRIVITDAALAGFTFSLVGNVLTYTGGSLTLAELVSGTLVASAALGGGVQLAFQGSGVQDARNDFNGDGRSDILWRHVGGLTIDWLGQANGGFADNYLNSIVNIPTEWQVDGLGDFNGDGRDDILWRHDNGLTINWLGEADGGFADNYLNSVVNIPTNWQVQGIGDFNGDGRDDILWRDESGLTINWLGEADGGFADNYLNSVVNIPTNWSVAAVGDFNGDGRDDILWREANGLTIDWLGEADGGFADNYLNSIVNIPTNWQIAGVGDFNGDGRDDILWREENGLVVNWLAQANGGFSDNYTNSVVDIPTTWQVASIGDFNGDGRDDILWRNDTGLIVDWLGEADGGFADNYANSVANIPTTWHVQAPELL